MVEPTASPSRRPTPPSREAGRYVESADADDRRGDQDGLGARQDRRRGDSVRRSRAGRRRRGGVQLDVKNFCCPEYIVLDGPADPSELERRTRAPAGSPSQVHDSARRHADATSSWRNRAARRCSTWRRGAPCYKTMQLPPLPREFTGELTDGSPDFRFQALMTSLPPLLHRSRSAAALALALSRAAAAAPSSAADASSSRARSWSVISGGDPGLPPKLAVPPFIALTNDAETQAAAKTIGEVLWDDLEFEKEFYMIPRDTYRSDPAAGVARSGAARSVEGAGRRRRAGRQRRARPPPA